LRVVLDGGWRRQHAVDLAGQRGLGEAGADVGGDVVHRDRRIEAADGAVWKGDLRHDCCLSGQWRSIRGIA
jgi:hypothetical protein